MIDKLGFAAAAVVALVVSAAVCWIAHATLTSDWRCGVVPLAAYLLVLAFSDQGATGGGG